MRFAKNLDRFSQDLMLQGNTTDPDGFVVGDGTISTLNGEIPRAVSIKFLREAARRVPELRLIDRDEYDGVVDLLADAEGERDEARRQRDELQETLDRITGLTREGFDIQKRRGPTPKVAA